MNRIIFPYLLVITSTLFLFSSCVKADTYQKQVAIPQDGWNANNKPEFEIEISDTTQIYDLFLLLRHDDAYEFSNIWIRINVQMPGDTVFKVGERLEIVMADPEGKWLGRNFGELWEQKVVLSNDKYPIFTKPGTYKLKMEQLMRKDPLENILNVGVNIQKRN